MSLSRGCNHEQQRLAFPFVSPGLPDPVLYRDRGDVLVAEVKSNAAMAASARNKAVVSWFLGDRDMWQEAQEQLKWATRGVINEHAIRFGHQYLRAFRRQ